MHSVQDLVSKRTQKLPGCVHLALDGWAAPNGGSFLGIVVLFLTPNEVHNVQDVVKLQKDTSGQVKRAPITSLILDFVKLEKAHTGEYLAEQVYNVLKEFGIELKVCYIKPTTSTLLTLSTRFSPSLPTTPPTTTPFSSTSTSFFPRAPNYQRTHARAVLRMC
jgi:hypothetical protein